MISWKTEELLIKEALAKLLLVKDSDIRISMIEQSFAAADRGIHAGGAFSAAAPLICLYYGGFINFDVEAPTRVGQDLFVLSKGHSLAAMASIYADLGYFDSSVLQGSRGIKSRLNGHPGPILPGVHISTGPLGQGLSVAVGFAIAGSRSPNFKSFCMVGDGELQEGQIWEAVQSAASFRLGNLCMLVDANNGQLDDTNNLILKGADLSKRLRAFGWRAIDADATKYEPLIEALQAFACGGGNSAPTAIICHSEKGYGGFSKKINGHKITMDEALKTQELKLQQSLREKRVAEFMDFWDMLNCNGMDAACKALEPLFKLNRLHPSSEMKAQPLAGALAKPAEPRIKALVYDEKKMPKLEVGKFYSVTETTASVVEVLAHDERLVSVDSDLSTTSGLAVGVSRVDENRALNAGIAEANMMGMAEGFAALGCNVWTSTFCPFFDWQAMRRIAIGQQERLEVISEEGGWLAKGHGLDIAFIAAAANLDGQTNGATHMGNDDNLFFDNIGGLKIIDICCPQQLVSVMEWIAQGGKGLVYLRVMRGMAKALYGCGYKFEFGKASALRPLDQAAAVIISSGRGVHEALAAADALHEEGMEIGVLDMPSMDEGSILELFDRGMPLLFAEQNNGFIYSRFIKALFKGREDISTNRIRAVNTLGADGRSKYIHSATYEELVKYYGLDCGSLKEQVKDLISSKAGYNRAVTSALS
ncbi:MAG: transketolase [Clostridiales bacterium]|jgi:transketolase|nr:transketolase [Clostridiales bacterium]